jgi:dipeptidyl aminopeptidase/acylaminoacyl peptidase
VLLVAENHPELRTLALKCPVSDYASIWRGQMGETGMQSWQTSGVTSILNDEGNRARLNYAFYEDILRFDAYASAGQIRLPTLIVHGDADVDVPLDQSKRLRDSLVGEKRLDVLPGADHGFSKPEDFQNMINKITNWMVEKLR